MAPLLHGDVDVGGGADPAVDQLVGPYSTGLKTIGSADGRGDGLRDRHVLPVWPTEHDPLAGVEVGRSQEELVGEHPKVVGPVGVGERLGDVGLETGAVVEPGGERLGETDAEVHQRGEPRLPSIDRMIPTVRSGSSAALRTKSR